MSDVTVPVLKPLDYQGRSYVRGQKVTMRPIDAAAAARAGKVSLAKPSKAYRTTVMTAEAPAASPTPARGVRRRRSGYQRADMNADVSKPTA